MLPHFVRAQVIRDNEEPPHLFDYNGRMIQSILKESNDMRPMIQK
jgi:hypothetical protein